MNRGTPPSKHMIIKKIPTRRSKNNCTHCPNEREEQPHHSKERKIQKTYQAGTRAQGERKRALTWGEARARGDQEARPRTECRSEAVPRAPESAAIPAGRRIWRAAPIGAGVSVPVSVACVACRAHFSLPARHRCGSRVGRGPAGLDWIGLDSLPSTLATPAAFPLLRTSPPLLLPGPFPFGISPAPRCSASPATTCER
jgi:hypothetical protein